MRKATEGRDDLAGLEGDLVVLGVAPNARKRESMLATERVAALNDPHSMSYQLIERWRRAG